MGIGFRVLERQRAVTVQSAMRFADIPVACLSDVMGRMNAGGSRLRPMHAGAPLGGAALTVRTRPGDNLMIHKALTMITPGDVLVVDGGGDLTNALMGELMLSHARACGASGVVLNGAIRDSTWVRAQDFPVFAVGVTHRGPYRDGPGEINVPVALDGMVIEPGDLVVGDADGIVAVPFGEEDQLLVRAREKRDREALVLEGTLAGRLDAKLWVDEALRTLGCEGV